MIGRIFTVGGLTLVSRLTGFARDIMLAAVLGAGPIADAFLRRAEAAQSFPRHLRRRRLQRRLRAGLCAHPPAGRRRSRKAFRRPRVHAALCEPGRPAGHRAHFHAGGDLRCWRRDFPRTPSRFALAVELTRITFPYLLLVSLVTLYGGILNALARFAAAAAAPILLNLSMMATLALAVFFPTPGHAAAWGVLIAGFLEVLLVGGDAWRNGVHDGVALAAMGRGRQTLFQGARTRDHRLGRGADRALRRHHHRELSRRRRVVGALLCRPPQSASRSA